MKQSPLLDVDPSVRREDDFYATPAWMMRALLRCVQFSGRWTVLEPCCGDGAIVDVLPQDADLQIVTNDIVTRPPMKPDFSLDATQRSSWDAFAGTQAGAIDVTVTNPPFDVSFDIVQHAIRCSRVGVIVLLRCTWIEPTDDRGPWLATHPPDAQIVMPRWNFRSRDGKGGSDSVPASWFVWNKQIQLCRPGIYVITKSERDELMA